MFQRILEWDRDLFIYLNQLGIERYDGFWSMATDFTTWIPLFLLFFGLIFWKYPPREAARLVLAILLLLLFIHLMTDLTKVWVARLRPNNDEAVNTLIRILRRPASYSFFSGHASTSFSITTLVVLFLRRKVSWIWLAYLWPLTFSFSRIYVGVHYPSDILIGALVGVLTAFLFYKAYRRFTEPGSLSGRRV